MIVKGLKTEKLLGFQVMDNETGLICQDIYAMTEFGELMRKDSQGNWNAVPKRGEYIVQYGGGNLEVW